MLCAKHQPVDVVEQVSDVSTLETAGDKVTSGFVDGGHDWFVWRTELRDFLTRVAFKPKAAG